MSLLLNDLFMYFKLSKISKNILHAQYISILLYLYVHLSEEKSFFYYLDELLRYPQKSRK
jgi:hypothetical protein